MINLWDYFNCPIMFKDALYHILYIAHKNSFSVKFSCEITTKASELRALWNARSVLWNTEQNGVECLFVQFIVPFAFSAFKRRRKPIWK